MAKTIKFTISLPAGEFREVEAARRGQGKTRSRFIRDALAEARAAGAGKDKGRFPAPPFLLNRKMAEERAAPYGRADWPGISADEKERRRRALAVAGKHRSGLSDVSRRHDEYLSDAFGGTKGDKE
ncbi:MAG: ribbon-helix-helix protein, CopG family [Candidatus Aminicenantes bacterium]|nr:ribbon-helix-helix protein, CopG family [Candidatus Aminicenantes bacterium]